MWGVITRDDSWPRGNFRPERFLLGILLSLSALVLEQLNTRRPLSGPATARLVLFAAIEDLGYRQLNMCWRILAFFDGR